MSYNQLPTHPPSYDDHEDSFDLERNDETAQNLNEIEQMDFEDAPTVSRLALWKFKFNTRIKEPIIDPILELYAHAGAKMDYYVAKLGNPLIVKRFAYVLFISLIIYLLSLSGVFPDGSGYYGSNGGSFADRNELLSFADTSIDLQKLEENLEYLSSMDHISGTKGDLTLAKFIQTSFRQSDMNIIDFQELKTLLNYANKTTLKYDDVELDLTEQFMPLSRNGEYTGNLIYAGSGRVKDYEALKNEGVTVEKNIAIIKFDEIYPVSQKILIAESYGIKGILFISSTDKFPDSFERRSCEIPQFYTGDPLTPGWSSSMMKNRIDFKDSSMAKIPTVSLTRNQIAPLLSKLSDKGVKLDEYHSGDGQSVEVTLSNTVTYQHDHNIWNVLGRVDGREQSDKAIIIGAPRDAPCKGAIYPNAGTALLLQLVELFTRLKVKFNWTPLRSIYFVSFDGTEYNFAGVTELIEARTGQVKKETLTYLDLSDVISGDQLQVTSSSLLNLDDLKDAYNFTYSNFDNYGNFIPFMIEGVPIIQLGYKGGDQPTPKYTCEDDFEWFKQNIDENFSKLGKLTQLATRIILKVADDPLVPFDVTNYVMKLDAEMKDLQQYAKFKRPNDQFNFDPIIEALLKIKQTGQDLQTWKKAWNDLLDENSGMEPSLLSVHRWNWNSRLSLLEKIFCVPEGIDGRRWYKNILHSPQLFKPEEGDYDWFSYPGIRDAIDTRDKTGVQQEIDRVGGSIVSGMNMLLG